MGTDRGSEVPRDERFMREALVEARKAFEKGEVPVGAIVVRDGEIIGRGHNLRESSNDPTAHAEMLALREAAERVGSWRLNGTTVYVTLEPCPMCAGALVLARVDRLVFGASDPKAGAVVSLMNLLSDERLNHQVEFERGVLAEECSELLREFFRLRRRRDARAVESGGLESRCAGSPRAVGSNPTLSAI